jgi:hypothetical protein
MIEMVRWDGTQFKLVVSTLPSIRLPGGVSLWTILWTKRVLIVIMKL